VQLLKRNLLKDHEIHKQDNIRIMKGNVNLIRDINDLRMVTKDGAHKKEETGSTRGPAEEIYHREDSKQFGNQERITGFVGAHLTAKFLNR
jgi:hypothetical protein